MESLRAKKAIYKIDKFLGEGLTGQVYKAFREDDQGLSRQVVALKIIHSQNQVQVLKKEFENLVKIHSKHCVKILAWENLERGSALVLEYIDGMTLHQLAQEASLDEDLILEIMSQCYLGLKGLHEENVFHGDLNLKNIMINSEGVVKLIDFGFQGEDPKEQYLTPQFSSPERQKGQPPTSESDLYSMRHIYRHLFQKSMGRDIKMPAIEEAVSRSSRRRNLSLVVKKYKDSKKTDTICMTSGDLLRGKTNLKVRGIKSFLRVAVFLSTLLIPLFFQRLPEYHSLNLRSSSWVELQLNQLPKEFGPIHKKEFRKGRYQFVLRDGEGVTKKIMSFPSEWGRWKKMKKNIF